MDRSTLEKKFIETMLAAAKDEIKKYAYLRDILSAEQRKIFDYIYDQIQQRDAKPTTKILELEFGEVFLPEKELTLDYVAKELINEKTHRLASQVYQEVFSCITNKDYAMVEELMLRFISQRRDLNANESNIKALDFAVSADFHEERRALKLLAPSPWKSLDEKTYGFSGGDFCLVGSRSGQGKTWLLLMMALFLVGYGRKILFASPEMGYRALMNRIASMLLRIPYKNLMAGKASSEQIKRIVQAQQNQEGILNKFLLLSDSFEYDVKNLRQEISLNKPEVVFVDGVYLLRCEEKLSRIDRASKIADEIKKMAKEFNVPIICSTQLNRYALNLKIEEMNEGHFVLSDAFAWNIDYGFIFGRDKDEADSRIAKLKPVKLRESDNYRTIKMNWDFYNNNFEEIDEESASASTYF